ncbi:hypothetical protein BJ546DRAFT_1108007 [Cryomyces antarcticus]
MPRTMERTLSSLNGKLQNTKRRRGVQSSTSRNVTIRGIPAGSNGNNNALDPSGSNDKDHEDGTGNNTNNNNNNNAYRSERVRFLRATDHRPPKDLGRLPLMRQASVRNKDVKQTPSSLECLQMLSVVSKITLIGFSRRTASCMTIQKMLQGQDSTVRGTKCKCSSDKVLIDGFHTTLGYSNNVKATVALGYETPGNARATAPMVPPLVVTTTNSLSQLGSNDLDMNVTVLGPGWSST